MTQSMLRLVFAGIAVVLILIGAGIFIRGTTDEISFGQIVAGAFLAVGGLMVLLTVVRQR